MAFEFTFPDVGEGITEGELLSWKVAEGEVIAEDQTLAEVETDKAVVEIPSPRAGRIVKLHAAEGSVIKVGQVLVTIDETAEAGAAAPAAAVSRSASVQAPVAEALPTPPPAQPAAPPTAAVPESEEEFYTGSVVGRLEEAPEEEPPPPAAAPAPAPAAAPAPSPMEAAETLALPSVRALARELGVDIGGIRGTGPAGRILRQDVEETAEAAAYGRDLTTHEVVPVEAPTAVQQAEVAPAIPAPVLGGELQRDEHGPVERVVFRGVRRTMARRMAESLSRQAQVTTTEEADVSILRRIREKERSLTAERGIRLTYLAFVVKAAAAGLRRFPRLNAVLSPACDEVVLKHYYNIGLAVDTPAGLVVPNIKDVDQKSIFAIAGEIVDLVDRAQQRRLDLSQLHGGTFTISNYGAIGGLYATPVTNYPEVAVLGMGRVRDLPVVRKGEVVVRQMLPLSLTFDHQLIDGAEATRFLNLVIGYVEDPDLLLLEGA